MKASILFCLLCLTPSWIDAATLLIYKDSTCSTAPLTTQQSISSGSCYADSSNSYSGTLQCNNDGSVNLKAFLSKDCSGSAVGTGNGESGECIAVKTLLGQAEYVRVVCDSIQHATVSTAVSSSTASLQDGDNNLQQQTAASPLPTDNVVSDNDNNNNLQSSPSSTAVVALDAVHLSSAVNNDNIPNNGLQTAAGFIVPASTTTAIISTDNYASTATAAVVFDPAAALNTQNPNQQQNSGVFIQPQATGLHQQQTQNAAVANRVATVMMSVVVMLMIILTV